MQILPSCQAAWLFLVCLAAGALPILLALELAGPSIGPQAQAMRRILSLMPLALLLTVIFLASPSSLWGGLAPHKTPWQSTIFFDIRAVLYLLIWSLLAFLLYRPPSHKPRFALSVLGLITYTITATLAANDWIGALEPGPDLASIGLLFIATQATLAAAAGRLLGGPPSPLMALLGLAWGFIAFTRFLTVWSADKPLEITYYLHRQSIPGQAIVWLDLAAILISLLTLLPGRIKQLSFLAAALVLLAHAADLLWMVTPAARKTFTITVPDIVAMLAVTALAAGLIALRPASGQPA